MKWPMRPVSHLCIHAIDCVNKTAPTVDYETPFKMIRTTNVKGGFVHLDKVSYVTEEVFQKWTRRTRPQFGDVILTREAPVGEVGRFTSNDNNIFLGQRLFHYRPNPRVLDWNYLAYVLQSHQIQGQLRGMGFGATVQHIKVGDAENLQIPCPPIAVQRRIGDVLSCYDDLIENNQRRMKLLEESARLLYEEWFTRLRFPGHEHVRITDGVPNGWERRMLSEVCKSIEDGDWIETKDQGGEDYRLLQISNIGMNEFIETNNFRFISEETFRRLNCRELIAGNILISRMPTPIGRAWLVTTMPWKMVTAVDAAILTTNYASSDEYFLTYHLNSPHNIEHCEQRAVGATRPRIARRELMTLALLFPPTSLRRVFSGIVKPIIEQKANLYRQNDKLRSARDMLLPHLMSGEIAA